MEPALAAPRACVERALQGLHELVQPALFVVDVSGALTRLGFSEANIRALVEPLCIGPHEIVAVGSKRAAQASQIARLCKLRAMDALYVWVAVRGRIPLCTLDQEMLARAPAAVKTIGPSRADREIGARTFAEAPWRPARAHLW